MTDSIRFKDIPEAVHQQVIAQLRDHSIGFARATSARSDRKVELLGSGTLVRVGDKHAILTAHHVLEVLPKGPRLGVLLDSTTRLLSLDQRGLHRLKIARGKDDSVGPDLAALILAKPIASTLAAQRRFFDLSAHREEMLERPELDEHGMWVVGGFVDELTRRETHRGIPHITFRNQALLGTVERCPPVGEFDYFNSPIDVDDRVNVPKLFGGVSGGGLWQIQLAQDTKGVLSARQAKLSGVVFYQLPTTATQCGLRCHGRRSVYEVAFAAIANSK